MAADKKRLGVGKVNQQILRRANHQSKNKGKLQEELEKGKESKNCETTEDEGGDGQQKLQGEPKPRQPPIAPQKKNAQKSPDKPKHIIISKRDNAQIGAKRPNWGAQPSGGGEDPRRNVFILEGNRAIHSAPQKGKSKHRKGTEGLSLKKKISKKKARGGGAAIKKTYGPSL